MLSSFIHPMLKLKSYDFIETMQDYQVIRANSGSLRRLENEFKL